MEGKLLLVLLGTVLLIQRLNAAHTAKAGDINVNIDSPGGTVNIYRGDNETADTYRVTITLSCIKEATNTGAITTNGHAFTDLSAQEFTVANATMDSSLGVNATMVMATTNLVTDARTVILKVYVFQESGDVTIGGATMAVVKGNVKVTVQVENWSFCGDTGVTCTEGATDLTAAFLDVCLTVTSETAPSESTAGSMMYQLGGDLMLTMKNMYMTGSTTQTMPSGYPMLANNQFTMRLAKFTAAAMFDSFLNIIASPEKDLNTNGFFAKVRGKSGKIVIGNSAEAVQSAADSIVVEFQELNEIDASGSAIRNRGYNRFANQDFTVGEVTDDTLQDIDVKKLVFSANLDNGAVLTVTLYMFKAAGEITQGDETMPVTAGEAKFTLEVSNWTFCTDVTCPGQGNQGPSVGEGLEFSVVIKGKGTASKQANTATNRGDVYSLGGGNLTLSKKLKVDDSASFVDMAENYPMLVTQGSKQIFKFRFPKFTSNVFYDPNIAAEASASTPATPTTSQAPEPASRNVEAEGVVANALGRSGKIEIRLSSASDTASDTVVVEFDDLTEVKADGSNADNNHRFNTFANQDFQFGSVTSGQVQGIDAQYIEFMATLTNGAMLKVQLSVFRADGTITQGEETTDVKKGNVKFTVEVSNWMFCGDAGTPACNNGAVGTYLDFSIVIKSKSGTAKAEQEEQNKGKKFDLGSGNTLKMSRKIMVDGSSTYANMTDGYPMLETQGSKQVFKIRLPKFTDRVLYDPIIEKSMNGASAVQASLLTLVCLALAVFMNH